MIVLTVTPSFTASIIALHFLKSSSGCCFFARSAFWPFGFPFTRGKIHPVSPDYWWGVVVGWIIDNPGGEQ
jgi:hypothetical protein